MRLSIANNYNDDFELINERIIRTLNKEDKGLYLLHGNPGCGKTSYIKYLTTKTKKRIIYLHNEMIHWLTDPTFLSFIKKHPDSILIIEDAERILLSRSETHNSPVSALLNLSDGILGDMLKLQIICTFNCELKLIDEALLRKGRLKIKYEFKELNKDKAMRILAKQNIHVRLTNDIPLCDVYNYMEENYSKPKVAKKIGF